MKKKLPDDLPPEPTAEYIAMACTGILFGTKPEYIPRFDEVKKAFRPLAKAALAMKQFDLSIELRLKIQFAHDVKQTLARIECGLVSDEQWQEAIEALLKAAHPARREEASKAARRLIDRAKSEPVPEEPLDETEKSIFGELKNNFRTLETLAKVLTAPVPTVRDALTRLKRKGKVKNKWRLGYYRPDAPPPDDVPKT